MAIAMKKNVLSVLAALAYLSGCVLFLYAFPSWIPALYFVSIGLSAVAVGLITWLFADKKAAEEGADLRRHVLRGIPRRRVRHGCVLTPQRIG